MRKGSASQSYGKVATKNCKRSVYTKRCYIHWTVNSVIIIFSYFCACRLKWVLCLPHVWKTFSTQRLKTASPTYTSSLHPCQANCELTVELCGSNVSHDNSASSKQLWWYSSQSNYNVYWHMINIYCVFLNVNVPTQSLVCVVGLVQKRQNSINSLAFGRYCSTVILKVLFSNLYFRIIPWAFTVKLLSGECHRTSLMKSQHWFSQWLGAPRQQAITWTKVDSDLSLNFITRPQWVNDALAYFLLQPVEYVVVEKTYRWLSARLQ